MSKPVKKSRLSRRTFGATGLAGLGAMLLGPSAALAQPPAQKKRPKRAPRIQDQQARDPATPLPPVEDLSVEIEVTPDDTKLTVVVALINDGPHAYDLTHRKWSAPPPEVILRAFGEEYALALAVPENVRRRMFMSRIIPIATVSVAARDAKNDRPSRILYATFEAAWPEALASRLDELREAHVELSGAFMHPTLRQHGLEEPLPTNTVVLDWTPPEQT